MIYHKFYHNSNEGEQGSVVMKFTHTYIYIPWYVRPPFDSVQMGFTKHSNNSLWFMVLTYNELVNSNFTMVYGTQITIVSPYLVGQTPIQGPQVSTRRPRPSRWGIRAREICERKLWSGVQPLGTWSFQTLKKDDMYAI